MQSGPNWSGVKLGDVCTLRAETVDPSDATGLPYVGLEHIDSGKPRLTRHGSPAEVRSAKSRFYAGDILYGKLRPYLDKAVCADYEGICSTDILVFSPESSTLPSFLIHLVHAPAFVEYAVRTTKGVNHPRTSWHSLSEFEFKLPQGEEQRAIARALDAVQQAKEARQRELTLERERKAALMEYLFTHGTRGEPTRQSEIGEIPESWQVKALRSIANIRYGLGQPPELDPQGVPMIRATDIKRGRVISAGIIRVKREAIPEARNPYLRKGDIIVVRSGAYTGDVAMYDGRWEAAVAGYDLVVSPSIDAGESHFLSEYLLGEAAQRYFRSQSDRAAQSHLNAQQLGETLIPLPSSWDEQGEIGRLLSAINSKVVALEQEGRVLDELFRAMLEELMTGRLSATPLIEERQAQ